VCVCVCALYRNTGVALCVCEHRSEWRGHSNTLQIICCLVPDLLLFVFIFCRLVGCQPADWIYCPSFQLLPDSTVVPRVSPRVVLYRAMALRAAALLLTVLLAALLIRDVDAAVNKPKLKWKHGGCLVTYAVWCDYGWYSSPYAGDINGDGKVDVIGSPGDIYRLKRNGATVWEHEVSGRTWPSVCVADLDKDGQEEIITAHGDGSIEVLRPNGASKNGWPQSVKDGREIRSLKVADLDNDGFSEVIVGTTAADEQVYVFRHDGQKKWSQTSGDGAANGYNHGIYSDSIGIYGKKKKTIIAPSDTHYIHVLFSSGILQTYTRCTGIQAQRRLCFYQQEEVYCNLTDSLGKYWCMDRQQRRVARLGS